MHFNRHRYILIPISSLPKAASRNLRLSCQLDVDSCSYGQYWWNSGERDMMNSGFLFQITESCFIMQVGVSMCHSSQITSHFSKTVRNKLQYNLISLIIYFWNNLLSTSKWFETVKKWFHYFHNKIISENVNG